MLDTNVLYPQWLRNVMLTFATMGYYKPRELTFRSLCNSGPPNKERAAGVAHY